MLSAQSEDYSSGNILAASSVRVDSSSPACIACETDGNMAAGSGPAAASRTADLARSTCRSPKRSTDTRGTVRQCTGTDMLTHGDAVAEHDGEHAETAEKAHRVAHGRAFIRRWHTALTVLLQRPGPLQRPPSSLWGRSTWLAPPATRQ